MKKRKEGAAAAGFTDLESVDRALAAIAQAEGEAGRLQAELEKKIIRLRTDYAPCIAVQVAFGEKFRDQVETWAEGNAEAFGGQRSLALTHGRIGWRTTPPSVRLTKKVATVVAALEARDLADAVITKKSVNKDVLVTYPADLLREVGAKREQKDVFFVDLKDEAEAGRAAAAEPRARASG